MKPSVTTLAVEHRAASTCLNEFNRRIAGHLCGPRPEGRPRLLGLRPPSTSNTPRNTKIRFTSTAGRCAIPSLKTQSRRHWPTASPLVKRDIPKSRKIIVSASKKQNGQAPADHLRALLFPKIAEGRFDNMYSVQTVTSTRGEQHRAGACTPFAAITDFQIEFSVVPQIPNSLGPFARGVLGVIRTEIAFSGTERFGCGRRPAADVPESSNSRRVNCCPRAITSDQTAWQNLTYRCSSAARSALLVYNTRNEGQVKQRGPSGIEI